MNPSELLSPAQQKACAVANVLLSDIDSEFWSRIKRIQLDALSRTADKLWEVAPDEIGAAMDALTEKTAALGASEVVSP